jgi:cytochrome c-type biogenesis protein
MAAVALALLAGMLTIAAPCTLPVLPALLGASIGRGDRARPVFMVVGFVASFAAAAVLFSLITQIAGVDQTVLRTAAAVLLAAFGALMLLPQSFEWLWSEIGPRFVPGEHTIARFARGKTGAFLLGTTLGLVWTPCAGPVLASILTLIATAGSVTSGALLLSVYAAGAGIPLLIIAWGGQAATVRTAIVARHAHRLQQGFGVVVIAFAVATYFDYDALIAAWLSRFYPGGQFGL